VPEQQEVNHINVPNEDISNHAAKTDLSVPQLVDSEDAPDADVSYRSTGEAERTEGLEERSAVSEVPEQQEVNHINVPNEDISNHAAKTDLSVPQLVDLEDADVSYRIVMDQWDLPTTPTHKLPPEIVLDVLRRAEGDLERATTWFSDMGGPIQLSDLQMLDAARETGTDQFFLAFAVLQQGSALQCPANTPIRQVSPSPSLSQNEGAEEPESSQAEEIELAVIVQDDVVITDREDTAGPSGEADDDETETVPPLRQSSSSRAATSSSRVDVEAIAREKGAPAHFFCSISTELMRHPVIIASGQTYERRSIKGWIRTCKARGHRVTCPITRTELPAPLVIIPNMGMRNSIEDWAATNAPMLLGPNGHILESVDEEAHQRAELNRHSASSGRQSATEVMEDGEPQPGFTGIRRLRSAPSGGSASPPPTGSYDLPVVVVAVQIIVFAWGMYNTDWLLEDLERNPLFGVSSTMLVDIGGTCTHCILEDGEWWRLGSSMWINSGAAQLLLNAIGILLLGSLLGRRHPRYKVLAVMLVSGLVGSIVSHIVVPRLATSTASALYFGLVGAYIVDRGLKCEEDAQALWERESSFHIFLFLLSACIYALGVTPLVDPFALVAGFLAGMLTALVLLTAEGAATVPEVQLVANIVLIAAIIGGAALLQWQVPVDGWCEVCEDLSCIETSWWSCQKQYFPDDSPPALDAAALSPPGPRMMDDDAAALRVANSPPAYTYARPPSPPPPTPAPSLYDDDDGRIRSPPTPSSGNHGGGEPPLNNGRN